MRNHRRPLVKGAGGEEEQQNGSRSGYRPLAGWSIDAAAWDSLTAQRVMAHARASPAIVEALLLAVGLEA